MRLQRIARGVLHAVAEHPFMLPSLFTMTLSHPSLPGQFLKPYQHRTEEGNRCFALIDIRHIRDNLRRSRRRFNRLHVNLSCDTSIETLKEIAEREVVRPLPEECYFWSFLYVLCRVIKPRAVVETGVQHGGSATHILQAMEDNGQGFLYSIDLPEASYVRDDSTLLVERRMGGFESGHAVPQHLRKRWELLLGSSQELLPALLDRTGEIDLFIHDSEHTYKNMMFEYEAALKRLRPGGVLVSDLNWSNAFDDFCRSKAVESFYVREMGVFVKPG